MDTLSIKCITWNVETGWPEQDLTTLLGVKGVPVNASLDQGPDIFIIGFQEVRSQPQNVFMDALFEEPWTTAVREILKLRNYVRVTGERLQGLVVSIYVKRQHVPHMRDIYTSVARTGFGGLWGNKGAACVRFSLYGCSICAVNAHLAPHDNGYQERCNNYNTIVDSATFPVSQTSNILYHDYVFWLGDLNFRLQDDVDTETILQHALSGELETLREKDELQIAQAKNDAFGPLTEGTLTFSPTYKYHAGSCTYDLARRPAWTDRILHQVHVDAYENVKLGVEQTSYSALSYYTQSDHKPVTASFTIKVFAHHEERRVRFKNIKEWIVGEMNTVKYTLDTDVETSPLDYVALFKAEFSSVHQYITYTYARPPSSPVQPQTHSFGIMPQSQIMTEQPQSSPSRNRSFQLMFNDELVQTPGQYCLLYYSAKYSCYLGMSEPFPVIEGTGVP